MLTVFLLIKIPPKNDVAAAPKKDAAAVFLRQTHSSVDTRRRGKVRSVGLLTRALRCREERAALCLPRGDPPVTDFRHRSAVWAHTAAVPSGIRTRLSCSAAPVHRRSRHGTSVQLSVLLYHTDAELSMAIVGAVTVCCAVPCNKPGPKKAEWDLLWTIFCPFGPVFMPVLLSNSVGISSRRTARGSRKAGPASKGTNWSADCCAW